MFKIKFTEIPEHPNKANLEFVGCPPEEFSERFERFAGLYGIKVLLADDELFKRPLKHRTKRICRFCKATYGDNEKFKSVAHLIPQLIGNTHLLSDFECDKCNILFSKYETDLANFLGVARSMNIENAKKGKIKFKSPDKTFIVKKDIETEANKAIPKLRLESHENVQDHFTLDKENKKVTFHTHRHSYNPYHVYKAFLKMGLSIIPDQYVEDYEIALAMLCSNKKNPTTNDPFLKLNMYSHPGPSFPSPSAILFEKKNKRDLMPMHIVCIMFHNYTYQLVLPLSKKDQSMYDGKTQITVPHMPPFIDTHFANKYGNPKGHVLNFNTDKVVKGEKNDVTFSFEDYTDTWFTDDAIDKEED